MRVSSLAPATQELKQHFVSCSPSGPTIIFISKMFPVARSQLPEHKARPLTAEELAERRVVARARHAEKQQREGAMQLTIEQMEQLTTREKVLDGVEGQTKKESEIAFLAFARVYSGCVEPGQDLWVIGPKYDPAVTADSLERGQVPSNCHVTRATVGNLYILLGRDLEQVDKVPVGNVLGMAGLSNSVLKSATLSMSTTPWCPPFVPLVPSSVTIL